VVHFFFQYWTGLPFGVAIVFFPLLVLGLVRAARRAPLAFLCLVAFPFALFAVYWGSFDSGLMREGLHPWVLTVLGAWALVWPGRPSDSRLGVPSRVVLGLRPVEAVAMALVPAWSFQHVLVSPDRGLTDGVALGAVCLAGLGLAALALRGTGPLEPVGADVSRAASGP